MMVLFSIIHTVVHTVKCVCCWVLFTLSNVSVVECCSHCQMCLFTLSEQVAVVQCCSHCQMSVVHPVKCVAQCCSHCQMWLLFTLLFALSSVSFFLFRSHMPKQPQQVCQLQSLHPRCVALWRREWLSRWVWRGKGCWLWWVVTVYSHCLWNIHWWTGCVCNSDWWTDCDCNWWTDCVCNCDWWADCVCNSDYWTDCVCNSDLCL